MVEKGTCDCPSNSSILATHALIKEKQMALLTISNVLLHTLFRASTMTQSGANFPFALPLKADRLPTGFQVG
jgi:hypothetical protein